MGMKTSRDAVHKICPMARLVKYKLPHHRTMYEIVDPPTKISDRVVLGVGNSITRVWENAEKSIKEKMVVLFGGF